MANRLGFVGIMIEDRKGASEQVNRVLSEYGDIVVARMGIPYNKRECSVITLIVDASTDQLGALTGKLGAIPSVSVKSSCAKEQGFKRAD